MLLHAAALMCAGQWAMQELRGILANCDADVTPGWAGQSLGGSFKPSCVLPWETYT
jgi:hypothetical protein